MGRRKIAIAHLSDDRNRTVTFNKRKNGLFKKAYELGTLCNADLAVIVFSEHGKLHLYNSNGDIVSLMKRCHAHLESGTSAEFRGPADFDDSEEAPKRSSTSYRAASEVDGAYDDEEEPEDIGGRHSEEHLEQHQGAEPGSPSQYIQHSGAYSQDYPSSLPAYPTYRSDSYGDGYSPGYGEESSQFAVQGPPRSQPQPPPPPFLSSDRRTYSDTQLSQHRDSYNSDMMPEHTPLTPVDEYPRHPGIQRAYSYEPMRAATGVGTYEHPPNVNLYSAPQPQSMSGYSGRFQWPGSSNSQGSSQRHLTVNTTAVLPHPLDSVSPTQLSPLLSPHLHATSMRLAQQHLSPISAHSDSYGNPPVDVQMNPACNPATTTLTSIFAAHKRKTPEVESPDHRKKVRPEQIPAQA